MLSSFLLLVFLTLSASSPRILTETHPIQSTAEDKESPFLAQRMLQEQQPVLISVQQITIPPPFGPPPGMPGGPPPGMPPGGPPGGGPPGGGPPPGMPPGGPPGGGPPGGGPPPGMPPGGPPGGGPPQPIVVTTKTYALDIENEEEIIIIVEDNQNPLEAIESIGDEQPQIANGDDVFISSWWTFEDGETAFESWGQLESYIGAQYGSEPAIGIDVDVEDVPVEIEIVVAEGTEFPPPSQGTQNINEDLSTGVINVTTVLQNISAVNWGLYEQEEIEGVDVVYSTNITAASPRKCNQVETCQKVFVKSIGLRDVCKVQLVCPKV